MMFEQPRYRPNGNVYSNAPQYGYREQLAEDLHQLILDLLGDRQTRVIPMLSAEHQFDMAHTTLDDHPEPAVGPFLDDLNRVATLLDYTTTLDLAVRLAQHAPRWRHQLTPMFQALYPLLNSLHDEAQPRLAAQALDSRHVGLIWRLRYMIQDYLEQVLGWEAVHGAVADSSGQSTASAFEGHKPIRTMGPTDEEPVELMEVVMPSQLARMKDGDGDTVAGKGSVPNNNSFDMLNQDGRVELDANGFYRTEGLGTHASMAELMETGALPGSKGVILTDRTVRFGDVYELGRLNGRNVEFSLVTEKVDGKLVKKLYSGNAWTSPVPKDARLIGHVHPNETTTQPWPSPGDMNTVNARYFRELQLNLNAKPKPTRIFWGSGDTDNTIFYPGFGKTSINGGGN